MSVEEDVRLRVRGRLAAEGVRLWLAPYDGEGSDVHMKNLAQIYSNELKLCEDKVLDALKDLKQHSIERAKANDQFKETGIAVLRLVTTATSEGVKNANIEVKLDMIGSEFITKVAEVLSIEDIKIKLIHKGRIVKHDMKLQEQGLKNGAQILVIVLAGTPEDLRKDADMYTMMNAARADAELLTEDSFGESFMHLEDQSGKAIVLPPREKKALTVAMALHERGRTALKGENYPFALVLLLEADKHFSECNCALLKSVDNYALLNLDISWCYLCLQSITHIPEAESRLKKCEQSFHNSYGPNLERLKAIKGTTGNEKALFMRLHLLQGIMLYHQNRRVEAKKVLQRTGLELDALKLNETSICILVERGYTLLESRIALRAAEGNIDEAMRFIAKTRKQKEDIEKKKEEQKENRLLGHCADKKQYVSARFVKMLVDMGFCKKMAVLALKKSNNIIANAVQIIQEQPDLLKDVDLPRSLSCDSIKVDTDSVQKLMEIGYDEIRANQALKKSLNDINGAIDMLMKGEVFGPVSEQPSTSMEHADNQVRKKMKLMTAAFNRLSEGIAENTESDYLDMTLIQEEQYLNQYLELLK